MLKKTALFSWGILTVMSCVCGSVPEDVEVQLPQLGLKSCLPEWHVYARERHPNGVPSCVVFYEDGEKGERLPVKQRHYFESGNLFQEMDLIMVDEKSPGYAIWKTTAVPHGLALCFYASGQIERFCQYDRGVLEGPFRSFFETGKIKHSAHYKRDLFHGKVLDYHANGQILCERHYQDGKLEGDFYRYYDSGQKEAFSPYSKGVINGKAIEWHKNGKEKAIRHYREGKLQSEKDQPAVIIYDEDHSIKEIQNFDEGHPHGSHVQYHSNNRKRYTARYEHGKIDGKEQFFDSKGNLKGEGAYVRGVKIGKHFKKHDNGNFSFLAQYDGKGKLKDKVRVFAEGGQKTSEYSLNSEEKFDGPYLSWYEDGQLHESFNYIHGEFEGEQKEYFPNGQIRTLGHYIDRMREGPLQVWYEDGQKSFEGKFVRGQSEGLSQEWHKNGKKKLDAYFKNGLKEGVHRLWTDEGVLVFEGAYDRGVSIGTHTTFFPNGKKREVIHFFKGKKTGVSEFYYEDGSVQFVQPYRDDLLDGEVKCYFPDGSLAFVGNYKENKPINTHKTFFPSDGKEGEQKDPERLAAISIYNDKGEMHGEQKTFYPSGVIKELVSYSNGVLHGLKSLWDEKGNVLKESWYDQDKLEGRYLEKDSEGRTVVYHYENNRKQGPHVIYYPESVTDGKQMKALEGNYANNQLEGELVEYDTSGVQIGYTNYRAGLRDGAAASFYSNGKPNSKLVFKQGKRDGLCQRFYPRGTLYKEVTFSNDQKEGEEKTYFEGGRLKSVYRYEENELDGLAQQWNESGVLIFEATYSKGKQHGRFFKFYDDGKPRLEHNYVEGKLEGLKKNWDVQGNLTEVFYKDGVKDASSQKS